MDAKETTLYTVCGGGVAEAFQIAYEKVVQNWADLSIPATKPRKIVMEIVITPFPDRSGADTRLARCEPVLAKVDTTACSGTVFMAKRDGKLLTFSRDLRQEMLFSDRDDNADGKTAASGG